VGKFVEAYNRHRCNHEEIEYLNIPVTSKATESALKNLPTTKSPGPDSFTGESYQTFKEEYQSLSNSSKK